MNAHNSIKTLVFGFLLLWITMAMPLYGQQSEFADLEYPYPVKYQEIANGQRVAFIDEGEGPPIILIHGLGSYIPAWKQNIPTLAKNHRVIALDLPGFGKSSKHADTYSIPFFAETVVQLQDSLGIDQAIWAGHSMGGQIALEGASTFPKLITKLVLIAPAGFEQFTRQEGAIMAQFVTPASIKATPESVVRQTFETTFYDFPPEAQFMAGDRVAIRNAEDFDGYANAYAGSVQAMINGPVYDKLSAIKQPALIIFGKQDALIPNKQFHPDLTTRKVAESGAAELHDGKLKMIDKAGHFVHFEQAGIVNKAVLNFINN